MAFKPVKVSGPKGEYESLTHPAKARKLLRDGRAKVVQQDPFTIEIVEGDTRQECAMQKPRRNITNFTDYFKDERDVYVQNIGTTQISLEFKDVSGNTIAVLIPKSRKPLNLTQHVAFAILKNSTDLRKMVNRRPPLLNLMNEGEFMAYYESLAKRQNTSVDEEIDKALEEQSGLMNKTAYEAPETEKPKKTDELKEENEAVPGRNEDQVTPAIVGLCQKADPDHLNRMKAGDIIEELNYMRDMLTRADLEYLSIHGSYTTVKKWAANSAVPDGDCEDEE